MKLAPCVAVDDLIQDHGRIDRAGGATRGNRKSQRKGGFVGGVIGGERQGESSGPEGSATQRALDGIERQSARQSAPHAIARRISDGHDVIAKRPTHSARCTGRTLDDRRLRNNRHGVDRIRRTRDYYGDVRNRPLNVAGGKLFGNLLIVFASRSPASPEGSADAQQPEVFHF